MPSMTIDDKSNIDDAAHVEDITKLSTASARDAFPAIGSDAPADTDEKIMKISISNRFR